MLMIKVNKEYLVSYSGKRLVLSKNLDQGRLFFDIPHAKKEKLKLLVDLKIPNKNISIVNSEHEKIKLHDFKIFSVGFNSVVLWVQSHSYRKKKKHFDSPKWGSDKEKSNTIL